MADAVPGETLQAEDRDMSGEQSMGHGHTDGGHGTHHKDVQMCRRGSAADVSSPPCQGPSHGSSVTEDLPLVHLEKAMGHVEELGPRAAGETDPGTQGGLRVQDGGPEEKKMFWSQLQKLKLDLQDEMRKLQEEERLNAAELEANVQHQIDRIAREFETLHLYLEEEKLRLVSRLEQEKEEVLNMSLEKVSQLEEKNASLAKLLTEIEEKILHTNTDLQQVGQHLSYLNQQKAPLYTQQRPVIVLRGGVHVPLEEEGLETNSGELEEWQKALRRLKSFGEIKQRLRAKEQAKILRCYGQESTDIQKDIIESLAWRRACHFSDDVVLDSESAHRQLCLSEDQRSVKMGRSHQSLPDSAARFDGPCVLGLTRFTSGDHYWEMKVEDTREWILGVCYESVNRKAAFAPSPESGYWTVGLWDGYRALNTAYPGTNLMPRVRPKVVGVFLNYDRGEITFYNVGDRSQLYSFPPSHFHDTLRPVLCMWDTVTALQIIPTTDGQ